MASKFRPKGSYKSLLNITSREFSKLSASEAKAIVNKLNDASNKRLKRIESSGFGDISHAYQGRGGKRFSLPKDASPEDVKNAYLEAKNFLESKTSSLGGVKKYARGFDDAYESFLGKPLDDPSNYDKRYKKRKVLKKSVKRKIKDFWDKYHEWREIYEKNNPNKAMGGTNGEDVEYFESHLFSQGKTDISDYEKKSVEDYLKEEKEFLKEDNNDYGERGTLSIQTPKPKQSRKRATKQTKYEREGNEDFSIEIRGETISILDDGD